MFKILPSIVLVMVVTTTLFVSGTAAVKLSQAIPQIDEEIAAPSSLQQIDSALGLSGATYNNSGGSVVTNTKNGQISTANTKNNGQKTVKTVTNSSGMSSAVASNRCIVTISGKSYDITSLKVSHSGGNIFTCGTNMTASYNSQHGSNVSRMQAYLVTNTAPTTTTNTAPATTTNTAPTTTTNTAPTTGGTTQPPANNGTFTAATLAQHNTPSNCYIAYSGNVYNVSNHPSWRGCSHYGYRGGIDITSIFPHRTTYLSALPLVGTYKNNGGIVPPNNGRGRDGDDNDDRDDDRRERDNDSQRRSSEKDDDDRDDDDDDD